MAAQIGSSPPSHFNSCSSPGLTSVSSHSSSPSPSVSSSQTLSTIANEAFCSFEEFCAQLPSREFPYDRPSSPQMIDSSSTLRFMVAKAKAQKISIPQLTCHIPLNTSQLHIISSIPTTRFKYHYVKESEYEIVSITAPIVLATMNVATGIAATAIGFNSSSQPICRGIIHFDKTDKKFLEKFLNQMITMGSIRIYLDLASGTVAPFNVEEFIKKVRLSSRVSINLGSQLLNPYSLDWEEIEKAENSLEHSQFSLDSTIDLIAPRLTMGICPNGARFVVKNSVWKVVNISKILRLHSFESQKETDLCDLAKMCEETPPIKEELFQDLIAILRDNPFPIQTPLGERFLAGIDFFLKQLDRPCKNTVYDL